MTRPASHICQDIHRAASPSSEPVARPSRAEARQKACGAAAQSENRPDPRSAARVLSLPAAPHPHPLPTRGRGAAPPMPLRHRLPSGTSLPPPWGRAGVGGPDAGESRPPSPPAPSPRSRRCGREIVPARRSAPTRTIQHLLPPSVGEDRGGATGHRRFTLTITACTVHPLPTPQKGNRPAPRLRANASRSAPPSPRRGGGMGWGGAGPGVRPHA